MTKEHYIHYRERHSFNIIYEYYVEHFDSAKHKPFLTMQQFAQIFPMTGRNLDAIMEECARYYDEKFNIVRVLDKDGNLIKVI